MTTDEIDQLVLTLQDLENTIITLQIELAEAKKRISELETELSWRPSGYYSQS